MNVFASESPLNAKQGKGLAFAGLCWLLAACAVAACMLSSCSSSSEPKSQEAQTEEPKAEPAPPSLSIQDPEVRQELNRYLSEFGMVMYLGNVQYTDTNDNDVTVTSWENEVLPHDFLTTFAVDYCSLFERDKVEGAPDNDWGVGFGGSADYTCNERIEVGELNKAMEKYFGTTVDFDKAKIKVGRYKDGYLYWGITAPAGQSNASLSIAKSVTNVEGNEFKVEFVAVETPDLYQLYEDGSEYYSLTADEAPLIDEALRTKSGWATLRYDPDSSELFMLTGWEIEE